MATAMPEHVVPMFARLSALPRDDDRFGYEVKWDGVRGIAYVRDGRLRLEIRNLKEVTIRYPEIGPMADALAGHAAVLDGEVVAFDEQGRPSIERLQHRMHLAGSAAIAQLARQTPVSSSASAGCSRAASGARARSAAASRSVPRGSSSRIWSPRWSSPSGRTGTCCVTRHTRACATTIVRSTWCSRNRPRVLVRAL